MTQFSAKDSTVAVVKIPPSDTPASSTVWRLTLKITALSFLTFAAFSVVAFLSSKTYEQAQSAFAQKKIEDRRQTTLRTSVKATTSSLKTLSEPTFLENFDAWQEGFKSLTTDLASLKSWDHPLVAETVAKTLDLSEQLKTLNTFMLKQRTVNQQGTDTPNKKEWLNQQINDQIKTLTHDFGALIPLVQKLTGESQREVDHATSVIAEFQSTAMTQLYMVLGALFAGIFVLHILVGYRIAKPYGEITRRLREMNDGNVSDPIAGTHRTDEFGEIARVLQAFRENALRIDQMQQNLQKSIADAKRSNQLKNQFFTRMTQELKAPLSAIVGYSDKIGSKNDEPFDLERLRNDIIHIASAGQSLLVMVDSVMELTDEGEGSLVKTESFNVLEEIQQVLPALEVDILKNHNKFKVSCPDATVTMASDPQKIKKALIHLIKNAAQFTTQGQIILDITAAHLGDMPAICFKVKDTGCGIEAGRLKTLFNAQDAGMPDGEKGKGAGLGLAIVKKITDDLHGLVNIDSVLRQGSTFSVTLPCSYAEAHERASKIALSPLAQAV